MEGWKVVLWKRRKEWRDGLGEGEVGWVGIVERVRVCRGRGEVRVGRVVRRGRVDWSKDEVLNGREEGGGRG